MEVAVESTTGLERRMSVQLPEDAVMGPVAQRLRELTQSANIPGFRPGKVPLKVITKRFGAQVRAGSARRDPLWDGAPLPRGCSQSGSPRQRIPRSMRIAPQMDARPCHSRWAAPSVSVSAAASGARYQGKSARGGSLALNHPRRGVSNEGLSAPPTTTHR